MKAAPFVRVGLIGLTALLALAPQASTYAGDKVDPATLIPPPPPEFNPVCTTVDTGVLCHVEFSDPLQGDQGAGFSCQAGAATYEAMSNQTRSVNGIRWYDHDLKLTEKRYSEYLNGVYKNPLSGASVNYSGKDVVHVLLTVPGDTNTGTVTVTGLTQQVFGHDGRPVLVDLGVSMYAGDGTFISHTGEHPFDDYFLLGDTDALQPICDALAS